MNWTEQLPLPLQTYAAEIAATARPCLRLQLLDRMPSRRWESCLGRVLFWPADRPWPRDQRDRPLIGLLQLNLAELPPITGLPHEGILQFFVADEPNWGSTTATSDSSVLSAVYHPIQFPAEVKLLDDFSFLPNYEHPPLRKDICLAVDAKLDQMPMPPEDYRFPATLGAIFDALGDEKWTVLTAYRRLIGTVGHRLGGYAGFVQDDPRDENSSWELLLQLDSSPEHGLFWGDYGVAHWYFNPSQERIEDLFGTAWHEWASS